MAGLAVGAEETHFLFFIVNDIRGDIIEKARALRYRVGSGI